MHNPDLDFFAPKVLKMVVDSAFNIKEDHYERITGKVPAKSNCYRIVTFHSKDPLKKSYPHLAATKELKKYEKDFADQCVKYKGRKIDYEFVLTLHVYFERRLSDLDNSFKVILDCLQKCEAIENDNLCVEIYAKKHIDKLNPRIEFLITKA